jgi:putative oxygen-independent coproporphyrinogen III oxidase
MPSAIAPGPSPGWSTPASAEARGFGVYVHWPFCRAKCPYCDFNSHVREAVDQARWRRALLAEIDYWAALAPGREVGSVFFGGGTPSLMPPQTVAALIERIAARWGLAEDCEITLEANPTSVEAASFAALRQAGVNRVSLGVQALDDAQLQFLGRGHSAREAVAAVELAQRTFARASFDLIYARPGQGVAAWRAELAEALRLAAGHLSLYQLTIEEGTAFHNAWARGKLVTPDEDAALALWEATQELTEAAGLPAYEVSNHARPGEECRHNLLYWRYGEYVGVGPGAHGRPVVAGERRATAQARRPEAWLAAVEAQGHATEADEPVPAAARREELLMMGLRLAEGVPLARFAAEGCAPPDFAPLVEEGFLELAEGRVRATARGRPLLDAILGRLLA